MAGGEQLKSATGPMIASDETVQAWVHNLSDDSESDKTSFIFQFNFDSVGLKIVHVALPDGCMPSDMKEIGMYDNIIFFQNGETLYGANPIVITESQKEQLMQTGRVAELSNIYTMKNDALHGVSIP